MTNLRAVLDTNVVVAGAGVRSQESGAEGREEGEQGAGRRGYTASGS